MQNLTVTEITPAELEELIERSIRRVLSPQPPQPAPDERLSRRQVCSLYTISLPTLHKEMKAGLPFEKIGRRSVFRRQDLDTYFKSKKGRAK